MTFVTEEAQQASCNHVASSFVMSEHDARIEAFVARCVGQLSTTLFCAAFKAHARMLFVRCLLFYCLKLAVCLQIVRLASKLVFAWVQGLSIVLPALCLSQT